MAKFSQKILIVEDEAAMIKALVDNLSEAGFEHILQARNGEEGLNMALSQKPDLILLDIVMPKIDGMTVLKKLRETDYGKNAKIIFLTNLAADESIMKGVIENEPTYYVLKANTSINEVVEKVKIALGLEKILG